MIAGVGIDIVDVNRIERLLREYGDQFAMRVLAASERTAFTASSSFSLSFLAFSRTFSLSLAVSTWPSLPTMGARVLLPLRTFWATAFFSFAFSGENSAVR